MADEWNIEVSGGKVLKLPAEIPVGQILTVKRGDQTIVYERVIEPVEPGSQETHPVWREVIPARQTGPTELTGQQTRRKTRPRGEGTAD